MSPEAARGSRFKRVRDHSRGPSIGARRDSQTTEDGSLRLSAACWMEIKTDIDGASLTLVGELDMACKERFMDVLKARVAARPRRLVIDLRSVTFIDSTGIALLLTCRAAAQEDDFELYIVRSSAEIVHAVFEAAGVAKVLPLCDSPPQLRA